MTLTVASYNIHKCAGLDRRVDLDRIAQVLEEIDADLVGVQEVFQPQALSLAERLGMQVAMGPTRERDGLPYGNAVLTRLAIRGTRTFDLSRPDREPRGGIRLDLEMPGDEWARGCSTSSTCTSGSRSASGPSRSACSCASTSCTTS